MEIRDYVALATAGVALLALWRTQYVYNIDDRNRRAKEIESRLNEFYSPLLFYIRAMNHLYSEFVAPFRQQDARFRTIPYLLEGNVISGNAAALLATIVELAAKIEEILVTKSGLIESIEFSFPASFGEEANKLIQPFKDRYGAAAFNRSPGLRGTLELLLVHIRVLRAVTEGKIVGEPERFRLFTYPKAIDNYVEGGIKSLDEEYRQLTRPRWAVRLSRWLGATWREQMPGGLCSCGRDKQ